MSWIDGARARVRLTFARRASESRMSEEIRFHIEMETERLVRNCGVSPDEGARVGVDAIEQSRSILLDTYPSLETIVWPCFARRHQSA